MIVEDSCLQASLLDSLRYNLRNKGLFTSTGKLHKGSVKDAYNKISIGSIPSNYESIIYHHEEKKGFGAAQKRFRDASPQSEIIGTLLQPHQSSPQMLPETKASYSKKGYGPFISNQQRQWRLLPCPSQGKMFNSKQQQKPRKSHKRPFFAREKQDSKRTLATNKENDDTPGPGYYDTVNPNHKYQGCRSAFLTKQKRQAYIQCILAPDCYTGTPQNQKQAPKSSNLQNEFFRKLAKGCSSPKSKHTVAKKKHEQLPGPGYYECLQPNFKPLYERGKLSHNFVQHGRDRFNEPIQKEQDVCPVKPNPCSYNLTSSFDKIEKKFIDMPVFMSDSKREPFQGKGLGPNLKNVGVGKDNKNFHFNIRGHWL